MENLSFHVNVSNAIMEFHRSFIKSENLTLPNFFHPYWNTFDQNKPITKAFFGIMFGLVGLCAVIGNGIVVGVFLSSKPLRTSSNMFIVNLAISDIACSSVFPLKMISSFYGYWIWGKLGCQIYGFSAGLFGFISLNTAVMIAIDRYLVIVQPCQAAAITSRRRVLLMIAVVWLWSLFWITPPFYGFGCYIPDGLLTSCSFNYLADNVKNYILVTGMHIFGFLIPVSIILFCYITIVLFVKTHARKMAALRRTSQRRKFENMQPCRVRKRADVHAAKVSAVTITFFIISWLPYATLGFLYIIGYRSRLTPISAEVALFFSKASALFNPLIYTLMNTKFRDSLRKKSSWLN